MPTRKHGTPHEICQIKITLLGAKPPIWRRVLVPSDMTLERLHDVVQLAMGWENRHLHEFQIGGKRLDNERAVLMLNVLGQAGAKALYTYDFGDGWEHSIVVEKVLPPEPGLAYPLCLDGKGHGPPEDCGGIPGFYNLLVAIGDPEHSEHEEMREWIGDSFDPDAFSVEDVNRLLAPLQRRSAKAKGV
ncbi:MAG: plasmid pRiA4b ORF-3 family protein [Bryobacteraceae bacterium]